MNSAEIRESYLSFFESKGCKRHPSSSLIPDDPSLLLTAAGMVQFKPVFLGMKSLGFTRATTCQKCVRTTDIDIIGTTGRHQSFFEMLGNFSFGDYFKPEACAWAWEYSTEVLKLDPTRIWISVFEDDDEAEEIWRGIGIDPSRIVRMGAEDNFWAAGPTGPCGPCSELYYDQGPDVGCGSPDCAPGCDCDRFLEYWNLVFMQYNRDEAGELTPLPKQNIDTGMGLERIAAILQGVSTNYETDILRGLIRVGESLSGKEYGASEKTDLSLRIVADHSRAVVFMIADGILPSNEGRGYVLRRLLRRAVRHGRLLGVEGSFLGAFVDTVVSEMGAAYPEIVENRALIDSLVSSEEERFGSTLRQGIMYLDEELAGLAQGEQLDGVKAFTLHDTYGFPFELTVEIAAERGIGVDQEGFEHAMTEQRERARAHVKDDSWTTFGGVFSELLGELGGTEFVGYREDAADSKILAIVVDGERRDRAEAGETVDLVLAKTPFYAERGGQVGDKGVVSTDGGARFVVENTILARGELIAHQGTLEEGTLAVGETVRASIDRMRRERIRRNHTATHLLHWALHLIVGDHVKQAGSLVAPDRLRFDFTHFEALTTEQLERVERLVNAKIMENHEVRAYETSLSAAREGGVTALFGEKYGEFVRVLEIGNFSKELCGGTHIGRTSEIGFVKITSEGSVGSNVRRIEAITSFDALEYFYSVERELKETAAGLKVPPRDVSERVAAMSARIKELESSVKRAKQAAATSDPEQFLADVVDVGYPLLITRIDGLGSDELRGMWDIVRNRMTSPGALVLASTDPESGSPLLLAAGTDEAVAAGFNAGAVIKHIAPAVKGGGGGKPTMAQAGGKDAEGIDESLRLAREMLGVA